MSPPHLSFTEKENQRGIKELSELGLPEGEPYFCFLARDSAYLKSQFPDRNYEYQRYRDSNICDSMLAAQTLVELGYYGIRMGAVTLEALPTPDPRIIDYSTHRRTDFLDIYLSATCEFFICDTAGLSSVPRIFRRPLVWVNHIPLEHAPTWGSQDLFIPKKLKAKSDGRLLTFKEILGSEIGRFLTSQDYEEMGIEVVNNTPEEIRDLVLEMVGRINGDWNETSRDNSLQERFWSHFRPSSLNKVFRSRIGTTFLRTNEELLQ
jgi:putative glycosyltransferase (TIGR04372 family)